MSELDEPITLAEVAKAIKAQKYKRAVGINNFPGELIKYSGDKLHTTLWQFFLEVWVAERVSASFKVAVICSLYKNKGDEQIAILTVATRYYQFWVKYLQEFFQAVLRFSALITSN